MSLHPNILYWFWANQPLPLLIKMLHHLWISNKYQFYGFWFEDSNSWSTAIRLFRIMSIPTTFCLLRVLTSEMLARRLQALDFRCQCTQQRLQSICAILMFNPQLKKILTFSVKDRYQLNYFVCICQFRPRSVYCVSWRLKCSQDDFQCLRYYCDNVSIS
jgi:hypothetical protein